MLNKEILTAIDEICDNRNISEHTKILIQDYLNVLSLGAEKRTDRDKRIENILKGLINNAS